MKENDSLNIFRKDKKNNDIMNELMKSTKKQNVSTMIQQFVLGIIRVILHGLFNIT